ncbi:hypothetical protein CRG98_022006 [Punica granatum]|uniref:Uncharacterized protein n=1 Tax=Punica granatum TaxID=22663 RepID=A0A2I0JN16_PUNGR|nr:hypothetical protein CRG98_022006 [Punica granatum]
MIGNAGIMIEAESLGAKALGAEGEAQAQGEGGTGAQFGKVALSEEPRLSNGTGKGRNKQKQMEHRSEQPGKASTHLRVSVEVDIFSITAFGSANMP